MDKPELGIHGYTVRDRSNTNNKEETLQGATRRQVCTVDYTGGASLRDTNPDMDGFC